MSERGFGYLDYGDTPAKKELYEGACRVVGGSILAAKLVMNGDANHAFNPGGGLHHAKSENAAGFCVFNDIAIIIRYLQQNHGIKKIAVVDIDGHHGDGTQEILYHEPILKISSHRIGIFPGTGYIGELGEGKGKGYSVNIPLLPGTGDEAYLHTLREVIQPLLESYRPEVLINQYGVDGHYQDPLVGLALTTRSYEEVAKTMHSIAHNLCDGRLLVVGGGGYNVRNTARCWAIMFVTICEHLSKKHLERYRSLFDVTRLEDTQIFEKTKEIVKDVRRKIFPIHGLKP
jgi:acetoin utilization protein AcuC